MPRRKFPYSLILVGLLVFVVQLTAHAQSTTATLSGTVVDQNGAVVAGATVTVINAATGQQRQTTTNDRGDFTVPLLPPALYTVRVERQGFALAEVSSVVLNVGDNKSLQISLRAGNISEMVKIEGDAPLINESPAVGTVVDRQFVGNLPLNGRSFQSLINVTPGTVLTSTAEDNPGQFSVNGQRANANYFMVDGVGANFGVSNNSNLLQSGGSTPALTVAGGTNNLVSVDALQEFRILTSTYAPEYGRTPGAQVSLVTRAGTNDFHGVAFEYFRNDALDANDWFNNSRRLPKARERQNDFGGTIGGPILKNRTFFFFSYERLRLQQPLTGITDVPSRSTRTTAPSTILPYLNAFSLPNGPDRIVGGVPNGLAEFAASFSNPVRLDATSIRIDHTFSDRLTLFGRYNYAPSSTDQRGGSSSAALSSVQKTEFGTQTLTLGSLQHFSANLVNDLRFNYSRATTSALISLDSFGGAVRPEDSILFPTFASPDSSLFSFFIFSGTGTNFRSGKLQDNAQKQINIVDSISIVKSSHQLKAGVDYRRIAAIRGIRSYDLLAQSTSVTPILLGRVSSVNVSQFEGGLGLTFNNFSFFAQDAWKPTSRLTLTYGLRWEINPAPTLENGDPPFAVTGFESPSTLALAPRGTRLYKTSYSDFAPRFGAAFQLFSRQGRETVLRGGVGLFYDLGNAATGAIPNSFPYRTSKSVPNPLLPPDSVSAAPVPFSSNPPVTSNFTGIDPNLESPRTYQWSMSLEQSLGPNQTVSATYVGAVGRKLISFETLIAPNPTFTSTVNLIKDEATSDYHALQLQYQRRLARGFQGLASYTWSHCIDEVSSDSTAVGTNRARGPCDFDLRHSFSSGVTYDIPSLSSNAFLKSVVGGWGVDAIIIARTATPVSVIAGTVTLPGGVRINVRPNLIQGVPLYLDDPTVGGGRRINRLAFMTPQAGQQGSLGRNALRGFSVWQLDIALRRQFKLTERFNLQFRAEFFNIFNHPNFANPQGNLALATFGQSTQMFGKSLSSAVGTGLNSLYQIGGPRSMQLALRLTF
jgi:Carboxypeptidase regulatory-like domain/TonB dependent receptor-like, beta-barrel